MAAIILTAINLSATVSPATSRYGDKGSRRLRPARARRSARRGLDAAMESFVHLRKGTTPDRLHADPGGLKDDELGRGGFTGRTAQLYRRNDPVSYRAVGPLAPVDVLADALKPTDSTDPAGAPLLLFSNADCRISLSR